MDTRNSIKHTNKRIDGNNDEMSLQRQRLFQEPDPERCRPLQQDEVENVLVADDVIEAFHDEQEQEDEAVIESYQQSRRQQQEQQRIVDQGDDEADLRQSAISGSLIKKVLERRSSSPRAPTRTHRRRDERLVDEAEEIRQLRGEANNVDDEFEEFRRRASSMPHEVAVQDVAKLRSSVAGRRAADIQQQQQQSAIARQRRGGSKDYGVAASGGGGTPVPDGRRYSTTQAYMKTSPGHMLPVEPRRSPRFRDRSATLPDAGASTFYNVLHWKQMEEEVKDLALTDDDYKRSLAGSPGKVEQRFLQLPESAEYEKMRSFAVDAEGDLVDRGYCYQHKDDGSPNGSTTCSVPASPLNVTARGFENLQETGVKRYVVLLIGAFEVGKTSLISQLQNCDLLDADRTDANTETKLILPILIAGKQVDLFFAEFDVADHKRWRLKLSCEGVIVMYSVNDKNSFSTAADILFQLRETYSEQVPIILVANKIDLERQRVVQENDGSELAKSYGCKFIEVSVVLGHQTGEMLKQLLSEVRIIEKPHHLSFINKLRPGSTKQYRRPSRTVFGTKPRANSVFDDSESQSLGRRLARSCENLFLKLWK